MAQLVKNLPAIRQTWVPSLGWEDPLEKGKATHSSILECMDCMVTKNQTWLSDFHFHFPMELKRGKEVQGKKPVPCHLSPPVVLGTSGLPSETCLAVNHFTCMLSPVWLRDAMDCSPPGSSVYKICQVRILEWIVMPSSRGSFQLQGQICTSCIGRFFTTEPPGKPREVECLFKCLGPF